MAPRRKSKRDHPSEVVGPNDSEDQHLPNEGCSDEHPRQQDGPLRQLTVMFCERELQKTVKFDASVPISEAKAIGSRELLNHLRQQPHTPPDLTFDDDCTDFFPVPSNDTLTLGDLVQDDVAAAMILWPKGLPGTTRTPSPYMDKIKLQAAELDEARSKLNMYQLLEEVKPDPPTKQLGKTRKPGGSIPTPARDSDDSLILEKLTAMGDRLTTLEQSNTELRESNAELRERNDRLEGMMQTTMQAVMGDRIAINKIRNRVLLDLARNKLAVICGYKDWYDWKSHADKDSMFDSALSRLQNGGDNISNQWKALHSRPTALKMLIFRNQVRSRGDLAAHDSAQKLIGESVLGLVGTEREDMCTIFAAVYGVEPVIDAIAT